MRDSRRSPAMVFLLHLGRLPDRTSERAAARRDPDRRWRITARAHRRARPPSRRRRATGSRLSAAVAAGVLAIGDEHGGAGEACMELIAPASSSATRRGGWHRRGGRARTVEAVRAASAALPGLGHRVAHDGSARRTCCSTMAEADGVAGDGIASMRALEAARDRADQAAADEHRRRARRGALRPRLPAAGGQVIFIVGRVAGLTAEVAEEHAREKPMRIRIPVEYDGVPRATVRRIAPQRHHGHASDHRRKKPNVAALLERARAAMAADRGLRSGHGRSAVPGDRAGPAATRRPPTRLAHMSVDESGMGSPEPSRRVEGARHSSRRAAAEEHGRHRGDPGAGAS